MFPLKRATAAITPRNNIYQKKVSTEHIVTKMLAFLKAQSKDELEDQWPQDALPNVKLKKGLSYSKMINVVNHIAPRSFDEEGFI